MALVHDRRTLCLSLMAVGVLPALAFGQTLPAVLPPARSLPDELALALRQGLPLVVMVSLEGCPYCGSRGRAIWRPCTARAV